MSKENKVSFKRMITGALKIISFCIHETEYIKGLPDRILKALFDWMAL